MEGFLFIFLLGFIALFVISLNWIGDLIKFLLGKTKYNSNVLLGLLAVVGWPFVFYAYSVYFIKGW